jgi:FAD/FMN-containing dehydrogenase
MENKTIIDNLGSEIGDEYVLTGDADREFYAMDVYNFRELPIAVVQPGTIEELQAVVRIASQSGVGLSKSTKRICTSP